LGPSKSLWVTSAASPIRFGGLGQLVKDAQASKKNFRPKARFEIIFAVLDKRVYDIDNGKRG
jgi:hypothetical protein